MVLHPDLGAEHRRHSKVLAEVRIDLEAAVAGREAAARAASQVVRRHLRGRTVVHVRLEEGLVALERGLAVDAHAVRALRQHLAHRLRLLQRVLDVQDRSLSADEVVVALLGAKAQTWLRLPGHSPRRLLRGLLHGLLHRLLHGLSRDCWRGRCGCWGCFCWGRDRSSLGSRFGRSRRSRWSRFGRSSVLQLLTCCWHHLRHHWLSHHWLSHHWLSHLLLSHLRLSHLSLCDRRLGHLFLKLDWLGHHCLCDWDAGLQQIICIVLLHIHDMANEECGSK
mmetsp:Transcript_62442/g.147227  ORF Transcript_62442/g.147227 Transcript_62442/m.147227 type:complete len:279 (-) Transcript_62442:78-914(-)